MRGKSGRSSSSTVQRRWGQKARKSLQPNGTWRWYRLGLTIGGTGQSIRFQPAYPIPTWSLASDYLRSLGPIAHANFITTTLAPMGEPAIENSENEGSTGREGLNK